jgi:hypothetical protein
MSHLLATYSDVSNQSPLGRYREAIPFVPSLQSPSWAIPNWRPLAVTPNAQG